MKFSHIMILYNEEKKKEKKKKEEKKGHFNLHGC